MPTMEGVLKWGLSAGWDVVKEFGTEAAAEYFFGGRGKGTPVRQEFERLWGEGKQQEALQMLKQNPFGWGFNDELMLRDDLLANMDAAVLDPALWMVVPNFLEGLTKYERDNFRLSHTLDTNPHTRRRALRTLAALPTDADRRKIIHSAGITKLTLMQQIEKAAIDFDASLAVTVTNLERKQQQLRAETQQPLWRQMLFLKPPTIGPTRGGGGTKALVIAICIGGVVTLFLLVVIALLFGLLILSK